MASPSPGGSGKAAWSAQVFLAHGIRALREAQSVIVQLAADMDPATTDRVHVLLTTAVEHARSAYEALIPTVEDEEERERLRLPGARRSPGLVPGGEAARGSASGG